METHLLALQAQVLKWIGLGWLAWGLWLGQDPGTVAWRAALGAALGMVAFRFLLDRAMRPIQDQLVEAEMEARAAAEAKAGQEAAEQSAKAAAGDPAAARQVMTERIRRQGARPTSVPSPAPA